MVPTSTGKMRKHFPVRGKSGDFEQTGKAREIFPKYWITEGILANFYLFILQFFKMKCVYNWLVKFIKLKIKNILENSGKFVSPKMWEPCICIVNRILINVFKYCSIRTRSHWAFAFAMSQMLKMSVLPNF